MIHFLAELCWQLLLYGSICIQKGLWSNRSALLPSIEQPAKRLTTKSVIEWRLMRVFSHSTLHVIFSWAELMSFYFNNSEHVLAKNWFKVKCQKVVICHDCFHDYNSSNVPLLVAHKPQWIQHTKGLTAISSIKQKHTSYNLVKVSWQKPFFNRLK